MHFQLVVGPSSEQRRDRQISAVGIIFPQILTATGFRDDSLCVDLIERFPKLIPRSVRRFAAKNGHFPGIHSMRDPVHIELQSAFGRIGGNNLVQVRVHTRLNSLAHLTLAPSGRNPGGCTQNLVWSRVAVFIGCTPLHVRNP